ncbi:MAG TPA: FecR domain-containing protein [Polyangiaceae bacterium]|nr:FecR domain-containing protein [Polyangiaceae bacterium]
MKPQEIIERFVDLAREASEDRIDSTGQAGLYRLERALSRSTRPSRAFGYRVGGAALAAALGLTALVLVQFPRDRALTFEVTPSCVRDGGYVVSKAADGQVRFSDHSDVGMDRGTRLRVSSVEVHGAHLMLEAGTLHASIRPRPKARWSIDAGPYVVHVTGTEFDLTWKVELQTLDLRLRSGSVTVEGPLAGGDVHMIAGDHLVANAGDGSLSIVDERHATPSQDVPSASPKVDTAPSGAATMTASAPAGGARSASAAAMAHSSGVAWATRVARGSFQAVIDDAQRQGIDRVLTEASQADLAALADAARYAHSQDLARRALGAQRARFPGSVLARDAAFFLGGLAESGGDDAGSVEWYETYLRESPDGAYASQALGRKMMLVEPIRGTDAARTAAAEYLRRFGDGPYAPNARKLLQTQ